MSSVLWLTFALAAAPAPAAGPCDLLDLATVSALVGQPVARGTADGPTVDEETGGSTHFCIYQAGPAMLIVSVTSYKSAAAAKAATTKELVSERSEEAEATITEETGLGERAFWAVTKQGAQFVVLKGANVLALALGGNPAKPPASNKPALRAAAVAALAKM